MTIDARALLAQARAEAAADAPSALRTLARLRGMDAGFSNYFAACQLLGRVPFDDRRRSAAMSVKVAFIGNSTPIYTSAAAAFEVSPRLAVETWHGEFDAWAADLLVVGSALDRFAPDVVVLHLCSLGLTTSGTTLAPAPAQQVESALRAFAARSPARLVLVLPEPLAECTGGASEADSWYRATIDALRAVVTALAADRIPVVAVDAALVIAHQPGGWVAARYWAEGKFAMHPAACAAIGRRLARTIEALAMPPIKAVAVDCDNVLWGGEVGEVGISGVNLSAFDTGAGYLRLQRLLKEAVANGIVLIALSKNDEANVREVFESRSEMLLALDDFSAVKVDWAPKAGNLQAAIRELNIGLDSVLFLDDSPFEREQMRAVCPQVVVPDLPRDADEYSAFVAATGLLERPILTAEDLRRRELYAEERQRKAARTANMSVEDFLCSLDLRLVAHPIGVDNLRRVAQLIAKTNQFNLTTRRHTAEAVAAFAADGQTYAYCFQLIDRFGDAGIVGVVIAHPAADAVVVDTLLMSCRVLGRTGERGMVEHLRRWAGERGFSAIVAEYRPTPKNTLISEFLPDLGFSRVDGNTDAERFRYEVANGAVPGVFVELIDMAVVQPQSWR